MKSVGVVCIDMMSGRHRTSNRVLDICSHVPPSNALSVLATNEIRLQPCGRGRFVPSSPIPIPMDTYHGISSRCRYIKSHEHVSNRRLKKMTLRYVPEALGGGRSICVTLGQRYTRQRENYDWGKHLLLCVRVQLVTDNQNYNHQKLVRAINRTTINTRPNSYCMCCSRT